MCQHTLVPQPAVFVWVCRAVGWWPCLWRLPAQLCCSIQGCPRPGCAAWCPCPVTFTMEQQTQVPWSTCCLSREQHCFSPDRQYPAQTLMAKLQQPQGSVKHPWPAVRIQRGVCSRGVMGAVLKDWHCWGRRWQGSSLCVQNPKGVEGTTLCAPRKQILWQPHLSPTDSPTWIQQRKNPGILTKPRPNSVLKYHSKKQEILGTPCLLVQAFIASHSHYFTNSKLFDKTVHLVQWKKKPQRIKNHHGGTSPSASRSWGDHQEVTTNSRLAFYIFHYPQ